ncbi:hypothetical protein ACIQF6_33625 [Kitasatospora sp. NPDC092948]|uniref:hypothetical protein n=1 Tax=Kitasatospora sp. NPDC092948 TaxID=3364088 RepID=UPI0038249EDC
MTEPEKRADSDADTSGGDDCKYWQGVLGEALKDKRDWGSAAAAWIQLLARGCSDTFWWKGSDVDPTSDSVKTFVIVEPTSSDQPVVMTAKPYPHGPFEGFFMKDLPDRPDRTSEWTIADAHWARVQMDLNSLAVENRLLFHIKGVAGYHDGDYVVGSDDGSGSHVRVTSDCDHEHYWWTLVPKQDGDGLGYLVVRVHTSDDYPGTNTGAMGYNPVMYDEGYCGWADVLPENSRHWRFVKIS